MQILAADIGGTKSWLCLYDTHSTSQQPTVIYEYRYISADFSNFSLLLADFFTKVTAQNRQKEQTTIKIMCLALPGVINNGYSRLTNLNWVLDETQLQQQFSIDKVLFINDFQAAAMGVNYLRKEDTITLNAANTKKQAITVVTGAGTGLGLAWMDSTQENLQLFSTEGGHCDFAPTNDQQIDLLTFLQQQYSHVSYERILSGSGLVQLYRFLNPDDQRTENTDTVLMTQIIHHLATDTTAQWHHQANSAIDLFVEIYGAYIGNLALLYKPAGGIYIAGGIATHILPWMQGEKFIHHYLQKGRMRHLAEQTALYLVTNTRLGLQGALYFALERGITNDNRAI
ncbi:MAG: glucokinase [Cocleimonas sp.]|nr:glucokinase [Cocleimonas sp.]